MRLIFISDTHSLHTLMQYDVEKFVHPNKTNILIHSGDCSNRGRQNEVQEFVYWFQNIKGFDDKIFIAGNHDFAFEHRNLPHHKGDFDWYDNLMNEENLSQSDVTYLEDNQYVLELPEFTRPIKFYGSPWQPEFYNWAFNLPRQSDELLNKWSKIPIDTDVLITHGPPWGILDVAPGNKRVGCELLEQRVKEIKPLIHCFGHIHDSYGARYLNDTLFINAAICTERYIPSNKPITVDIQEIDGQIITNIVN